MTYNVTVSGLDSAELGPGELMEIISNALVMKGYRVSLTAQWIGDRKPIQESLRRLREAVKSDPSRFSMSTGYLSLPKMCTYFREALFEFDNQTMPLREAVNYVTPVYHAMKERFDNGSATRARN